MAGSIGRIAAWQAGVWGVLGTFAPALVDLSTSDWFGAGDLRGLVFYTLPLLLVLVVIGIALAPRLVQRPMWVGLVVGGTVGIGIGFLWTLANALLLGPLFGAWSFPVLLCWTTGGGLGLAAAATSGSARSWRRVTIESATYFLWRSSRFTSITRQWSTSATTSTSPSFPAVFTLQERGLQLLMPGSS